MSRPATLLGPLDGLTAEVINRRFMEQMAGIEWGRASLPEYDGALFSAYVAELENAPRLFTFVDLFCGAGGSSTGLVLAGGRLLFAANHSKNNIAIHAENHTDAEHACVDLDHYDMRNIPRGADVLWASPICTELSPAGGTSSGKGGRKPKGSAVRVRRGRKVEVTPGQDELEIYGHVPQEDYIRTRATFHDVIRATEVHEFKYVIIENVVEAAWKWRLFAWFLMGMEIASQIGYGFQILSKSAAHVGDALNPQAAQRRDRMYIVFHRLDMPKPDLEHRPVSWCPDHGLVEGVQFWKDPRGVLTASGKRMQVGKYGPRSGQYYYACPHFEQHKPDRNGRPPAVTPLERPAAAVIDWTDLGVPIGEREAHGLPPLVPNTIRRVAAGMQMFGRPIHLAAAGNTFERPGYVRAWAADETPLMTQQTTTTTGLACPPLIVNHAHTDDRPFPADERALPSATTKIGQGLVIPPQPFVVKNQSDANRPQDRVAGVDQALGTVTTGRNQSLIVPSGAFVYTARNNSQPTSAWEATTAMTAGGNNHALVVPYHRTAVATSAMDTPMPTMTTHDRAGLASGFDDAAVQADVLRANYRTMWWYEQAGAQRFLPNYRWVGTAGQRTAGAGNAVAVNVACWIGQRVAAALNRTVASPAR